MSDPDLSASPNPTTTVIARALRYRPFLFTKKAEFSALRALDPAASVKLTPTYVVHPRDLDFDNGKVPKKSLDDHVAKVVKEIVAAGISAAHVDVGQIEAEGPLKDGTGLMEYILDQCAVGGVDLVPLVRPTSSTPTVAAVRSRSANGVAICLESSEWPSINPRPLGDILSRLAVAVSDVDLLIYFGSDRGSVVEGAVCDALAAAASYVGFRSVTAVGAAFPKVAPTGIGNHEVDRTDFATFRGVTARCASRGLVVPDYGDWTISYPDLTPEVDPRFMNIAASFRYPTETSWIVGKGELFKGNGGKSKGSAAVPPMLRRLQSHPQYGAAWTGRTERWIEDAGAEIVGSGNAATWRQWAILRHLELTLHQLANLI